MPVESLLLFMLLALLAEVLGTVGGFGSSLFFVPIAGFFLDFHTVLGITALFHISSNLSKIALFRNGFDKGLILSFGIPAIAGVILGAYLSQYANAKTLEMILSAFLILVSLVFLIYRQLALKPNLFNSVSGGLFSGFAAGLIGTGGTIRGITLASYNLRIEVFIATSAMIDLGIDLSRSVVYVANGYVSRNTLYLIPILLVVSLAGTYIGKRILKHISEQQFKTIVLLLILTTGLVTLFRLLIPSRL